MNLLIWLHVHAFFCITHWLNYRFVLKLGQCFPDYLVPMSDMQRHGSTTKDVLLGHVNPEGYGLSFVMMIEKSRSLFEHDIWGLAQAVDSVSWHAAVSDVVSIETQMLQTWIVQRSHVLAETWQVKLYKW